MHVVTTFIYIWTKQQQQHLSFAPSHIYSQLILKPYKVIIRFIYLEVEERKYLVLFIVTFEPVDETL